MDKKDTIEDRLPKQEPKKLTTLEILDKKLFDFTGTKTAVNLTMLSFVLMMGGVIAVSAVYGSRYELPQLKQEYEKCASIKDKTQLNDCYLGKCSCQAIEERYKKLFSE